MTAVERITRFFKEQTQAAKQQYDVRGEKPIGVYAMILTMSEMNLRGIKGIELMNEHKGEIRKRYIGLAEQYGKFKPASGWSNISSGQNGEMVRKLRNNPNANYAFSELDDDCITALLQHFDSVYNPPE